jgi:hypothetical protein
MKCAILENLSTTTKIESLPFFDLGKPKTKSIEISTQRSIGTGNGVYSPCGCTLDFAFYKQCTAHKFVAHLFSSLANKNAHAMTGAKVAKVGRFFFFW